MSRLLIAFLARLSDATLAESIVGDLIEERARRRDRSAVRARIWYWSAAMTLVGNLVRQRFTAAIRVAGWRSAFGGGGGGRELRQALRSLRRTPWYSLTVIGVIALSMTLATTVFAIVDGVLFKPLPYPRAEELFIVGGSSRGKSIREVREWAAAVPEAALTAYQQPFEIGFAGERKPAPIRGAAVDRNFFEVLGLRPHVGGFAAEHFEPTGGLVPALISHRLWRQQFGGNRDVIGKPLRIAGAANHMATPLPGFVVTGILPADFVYPSNRFTPDVIIPLALTPEEQTSRNAAAAAVLLRLPRNDQRTATESRLTAVAAAQGLIDASRGAPQQSLTLRPLSEILVLFQHRDSRTVFIMSTVLVLLACINVAGLTVARNHDRQRQLALRQALGATRWDLTRHAIHEVAPLVIAATLLGLLVTQPLLQLVTRLMPSTIALLTVPSVDSRVLVFTGVATALVMAIVVLTQGRVAASADISEAIGRGHHVTGRGGLFAGTIIAVQVALSFVLAIAGTLLVSSLFLVWQEGPGFDADRVVLVEIDLGSVARPARASRLDQALARVRSLPGVSAVGVVNFWFMRESGGTPSPGIRRPATARPGDEGAVMFSGAFFDVMGIRAIEGRLPTREEVDALAPVLVVSARAAANLWPETSAVGQTLTTSNGARVETVIGVVPDAKYAGLDRASRGEIYRATAAGWPQPALLLRTNLRPSETMRQAVAQLGAGPEPFQLLRAVTLEEALDGPIRVRTFRAWLFGTFAVAALIVSGAGILGLIAMSTARRTREMGIRCALGARRDSLVRMLMGEQLIAVASGVAIGGLAAVWAAQFVRSYLYQFTVYDARLWTIATAVILSTSVIGTVIPALRASRVDPVLALRVE